MTVISNDFGFALGRAAKLFTISDGDLSVSVTDFGATITDIVFEGKNGPVHAVLGYPSAEGYAKSSSFLGATVGRYAGRIGGAAFTLNGKRYHLDKNDGENYLHGGFSKRFWDAEASGNAVRFTLVSPDGDTGFPGRLTAGVTISVSNSVLRIEYDAAAEKDTPVNLTNHSYFNLNGGGDVSGHLLSAGAFEYAELGEGNIPTGRILPVGGTALDFRSRRPLAEAISDASLKTTRGVDHSFIIPGEGLREAARLCSYESGILMINRTTKPTVHIYTAGFLDLDTGGLLSNGEAPSSHAGICFETQSLPDSPNKPTFPSTILKAGESLQEIAEFEFCRLTD